MSAGATGGSAAELLERRQWGLAGFIIVECRDGIGRPKEMRGRTYASVGPVPLGSVRGETGGGGEWRVLREGKRR